ncbi:MAG: Calx-beta domain-containing protein [Cyanobacteria bacterium P01_G01_bin.54]
MNQKITYEYDEAGQLIRKSVDLGNDGEVDQSTEYTTKLTHVLSDDDNDGVLDRRGTFYYNGNAKITRSISDFNSEGSEYASREYEYNQQGLEVREAFSRSFGGGPIRPSQVFTSDYDEGGNLIRYVFDDRGDGVADTITTHEYGANSHTIRLDENADGTADDVRITQYDADQNVIATTHSQDRDFDGNVDSFEYREFYPSGFDRLAIIRQDNNSDGSFDSISRSEFQENVGISFRGLDIDGDGTFDETFTFEYDSNNNIIEEKVDQNGDGVADFIKRQEYDAHNNLIRRSFDLDLDGIPESIDTYENRYDSNQNLIYTSRDSSSDGIIESIRFYEYDANSNLTLSARDDDGDGTPNYIETYGYDPAGNRILETTDRDGNGIPEYVRSYDAEGHPLDSYTYNPDGTLYYHQSYRRNANGQTIFNSRDTDGDGNPNWVRESVFDAEGRRISETQDTDGDGITNTSTQYVFNRVTGQTDLNNDGQRDATTAYIYNREGVLIQEQIDTNLDGVIDSVVEYEYGINGQRLSKTFDQDADGIVNEQTIYTYDSNGRLATEAYDRDHDGSVDQLTTYNYNASGVRVTADIDIDNDGSVDDVTTYRYNLQGQLMSELTEAAPAVPVVKLLASVGSATEEGGIATYQIERDNSDGELTVEFRIDASSTARFEDYNLTGTGLTPLSDTEYELTFNEGQAIAEVTLTAIDDALVETAETVVLELQNSVFYQVESTAAIATATITDNDLPRVSIISPDDNATEAGDTAAYYIERDSDLGELTVKFMTGPNTTANSNDYTFRATGLVQLSDTEYEITLAAGQTIAEIMLTATDDAIVEPTEGVVLELQADSAYAIEPTATAATATIADNDLPTVNLAALDANASETGNTGIYRLERDSILQPLTVRFTISPQSTAQLDEIDLISGATLTQLNATDYEVTFASGSTIADITITPRNDELGEREETLVLQLNPGRTYQTGAETATVAIAANDLPTASITAPPVAQPEGSTQDFTVTLSNPSSQAVTVNYTTADGSADGQDYAAGTGQITFAPGELSQTLTIATTDDAQVENDETFSVRLLDAIDALIDPNAAQAAGVILNNDDPVTDPVQPPVNYFPPAPQSLQQGETLVFSTQTGNGIAITGPDADETVRVALSVQGGTLSLANRDGLTFSQGDGRDDAQLNVTGTQTAINRALNGLRFTPDDQFSGTAQLQILSESGNPLNPQQDQDTLAFEVLPPDPTALLTRYEGNWFSVGGTGSQTLQLTLTGQETQSINELGMFKVDDALGTIDSIAPGEAGYTEAAIGRSRVVMSALSRYSDNLFPGLATTRHLAVDSDSHWGFYLVGQGTTDTIKDLIAQGQTPGNLAFGFPSSGGLRVEQPSNGRFKLRFDDGVGKSQFKDFEVTLTPTLAPPPIGTNLQDRTQGELIDLREYTGFQAATFQNFKHAGYKNSLGFYGVDNEAGYVDDLAPGDTGYAAAALARRVDFSQGFEGGQLLAPYLVANATPEAFLARNPTNQAGGGVYTYFAYLGANPDGIDHVRLLGDNTFAFEDLYGGGDLDYNDAVIQINFA